MTQNESTRSKIVNSDRNERRDEPCKTVLALSIFVHPFGNDRGIMMMKIRNTRISNSPLIK